MKQRGVQCSCDFVGTSTLPPGRAVILVVRGGFSHSCRTGECSRWHGGHASHLSDILPWSMPGTPCLGASPFPLSLIGNGSADVPARCNIWGRYGKGCRPPAEWSICCLIFLILGKCIMLSVHCYVGASLAPREMETLNPKTARHPHMRDRHVRQEF
jgi:hypothetical protein